MSEEQTHHSRPPQKFFDVVKPGQSPPSSSSKPIIVSNRPPQPDPMMSRPVQQAAAHPLEPKLTSPEQAASIGAHAIQATKPHGAHHRLRIMLPLLIGIVVLFVIADLLIDAGVVHTSVTPLTHFFHHH